MKNIVLLLLVGFGTTINAQTTKKIVKKIEKSKTEINDDKDAKSSKSMAVEKEIVNGKEVSSYTLTIKENGEKKIVKWNGEGEMPKEIEAELARMEGEQEGEVEMNEEHEYIIEENQNGTKKVMVWKGDGEMPEEMKKMMEENGENVQIESGDGEMRVMKFISEDENDYDVKVKMGIGLSQGKEGVRVEKVMENSAASKSGIREGDIILKMDDTYIMSDDKLMEFLSNKSAGEKVKVTVLRGGKEQSMKLQLEPK